MRVVDERVERNIDMNGSVYRVSDIEPPFLCWGRRERGVCGRHRLTIRHFCTVCYHVRLLRHCLQNHEGLEGK